MKKTLKLTESEKNKSVTNLFFCQYRTRSVRNLDYMKSNQIYLDSLALETQSRRREIERATRTLTFNILLMPHD